jgi:hypothetical protein
VGRTLCNLKKLRKKDFAQYAKLVDQPRVICKNCGRAADRKKYVCKPRKIRKTVKKRD